MRISLSINEAKKPNETPLKILGISGTRDHLISCVTNTMDEKIILGIVNRTIQIAMDQNKDEAGGDKSNQIKAILNLKKVFIKLIELYHQSNGNKKVYQFYIEDILYRVYKIIFNVALYPDITRLEYIKHRHVEFLANFIENGINGDVNDFLTYDLSRFGNIEYYIDFFENAIGISIQMPSD